VAAGPLNRGRGDGGAHHGLPVDPVGQFFSKQPRHDGAALPVIDDVTERVHSECPCADVGQN
jgi:hypothetical protein